MAEIRQYRIGKPRLGRAYLQGFFPAEDGSLRADAAGERHALFLRRLDSAVDDCMWGRFAFDAQCGEDAVLVVRAFASNDPVRERGGVVESYDDVLHDAALPLSQKFRLFEEMGGIRSVGHSDVLLYGQTGRYLWISVELIGKGEARLDRLRVYAPGDNFLQTFPEIYRMDGDFLHRYLSIFSSLYDDLAGTVRSLPEIIDIDRAPAEVLPLFAGWLGIELDGDFLEEKHLRRLLKNAYKLISHKGTRRAIEEVVRIFVEEPFFVVEHRLLQDYTTYIDRAVYDRLYGTNPFGVTILLGRAPDERLHSKLLFLLGQFKPLRCRIQIVFLGSAAGLDGHSYMDINACALEAGPGALDGAVSLGDLVYIQ